MANVSTQNSLAWNTLFNRHNILSNVNVNGSYIISASCIGEVRQARLMTKFDNSNQVPDIFTQNNLSILPISRTAYIIGRFEIFHKFESIDDAPTEYIHFPHSFETLDFENISSESLALSCAFNSRILDDFFGENVSPTISGKMGTQEFDFLIRQNPLIQPTNKSLIEVNKAQIEIDGGYEGERFFNIVEAKNYLSNDFVIRQLYYPYRRWQYRLHKTVRTHYLTYSDGTFEFREYAFQDLNCYNSLKLVKAKKYKISSMAFNLEVLEKLIYATPITPEPDVPFPQADSIKRIFNLLELLHNAPDNEITTDEITSNFAFDVRQTDYYINACKYLGLAEKIWRDDVAYGALTDTGKRIFSQNIDGRRVGFIQQILSKEAFKKTLQIYLANASTPSKEQIVKIMKNSNLRNIDSESTYHRRASTILQWVCWVIEQANNS